MPVPRQRLSSRRGRTRAAHHALASITTTICPQCKQPTRPHVACPSCGFYKGRNINERPTKTTPVAASATASTPAPAAPVAAPSPAPAPAPTPAPITASTTV